MNMARVYKTKDSDAVPMQLLNVFVNYFSLIIPMTLFRTVRMMLFSDNDWSVDDLSHSFSAVVRNDLSIKLLKHFPYIFLVAVEYIWRYHQFVWIYMI